MGICQAQSRLSAVSSHPFGAPIGGVRVAHLLSPPFVPTQIVPQVSSNGFYLHQSTPSYISPSSSPVATQPRISAMASSSSLLASPTAARQVPAAATVSFPLPPKSSLISAKVVGGSANDAASFEAKAKQLASQERDTEAVKMSPP